MSPPASRPNRPAGRWLFALLGGLFTALAVAGMLLPVMPTTVFLLLALACFSRSSPRLASWLLQHPLLGPPLQRWQQHRIIPQRAKLMACVGMSVGFLLLASQLPPRWLLCAVSLFLLASMLFVLSRPSSPLKRSRLPKVLIVALTLGLHTAGFAWTIHHIRQVAPNASATDTIISSHLPR